MNETKRPFWSNLLIVINILLMTTFLIFSAVVVYITADNTQPDGEIGRTFLMEEEQGGATLVFLDKKVQYSVGDSVLIRMTLGDTNAYFVDEVASVDGDRVTLSSGDIQYTESVGNIIGQVQFQSGFFGTIAAYMTDSSHTVPIIITAAASFLILVFLTGLTIYLFRKKQKRREQDIRMQEILDQMFNTQKEEPDFVQEVFQQEIREPEEIDSTGDDEKPLSEEELEQFREKILDGTH